MSTIYIRDVPEPLHNRFKAACAEQGVSMRDAIMRVMQDYIRTASNSKLPQNAPELPPHRS